MPPNPIEAWPSESEAGKNEKVFDINLGKIFVPDCIENILQAEARLAARRQARYEARNIRMRELEKKQKEEEETNGSLNHGSHSLVTTTSSTNSNHNNIHSASGKTDLPSFYYR